ncbi:MAG TPA: DUF364 domain-containing protein [Polyangiales bacterium]
MDKDLYDTLIQHGHTQARVRSVLLGLNWSVCRADGVGVCFSPTDPPRTLPWSGTLVNRRTDELASWLRSFDPVEATVGALVVNACVNHADNALLRRAQPLSLAAPAHLQVFAHFAPWVRGASVAVVGRYPGLEALWQGISYQCLERRPGPGVLPDTAAEYVLPRVDWVFLTASAIANKTLPRLLALSRQARVVLMGPSLPWLEEWADWGVDYLAGVAVTDEEALIQTAAEAGGTRIFETGVGYRLASLG